MSEAPPPPKELLELLFALVGFPPPLNPPELREPCPPTLMKSVCPGVMFNVPFSIAPDPELEPPPLAPAIVTFIELTHEGTSHDCVSPV